ncbi:hypothetical protein BVV10_20585 [Xanthomonas oryzae pv. oryzae]|nr:hypothetical protein BVV16_20590 [Xanthomonas oryzae pv. oryzae]AUI95639.1 hypothetical protein BVV17_20620 [Xanthomonas oryzae pv. oryzae]AUI99310.1 hypothetical protein BVV18_20620 [Xanthomonas oryzae pv. oryzae]AUJ02987.1 hypothetical protein BVV10_20585 [Xanthomonas oryzae pv. oryzae]AUJ06652.1 hypothetical protein BVV19_20665 [Xanthomonas oryzae pv. oryzae]
MHWWNSRRPSHLNFYQNTGPDYHLAGNTERIEVATKNLFTIFFRPCKLHECARRTIQVT